MKSSLGVICADEQMEDKKTKVFFCESSFDSVYALEIKKKRHFVISGMHTDGHNRMNSSKNCRHSKQMMLFCHDNRNDYFDDQSVFGNDFISMCAMTIYHHMNSLANSTCAVFC